MKQEILREMRKEVNKAKQEIIDGEENIIKKIFKKISWIFVSVIRAEMSRR